MTSQQKKWYHPAKTDYENVETLFLRYGSDDVKSVYKSIGAYTFPGEYYDERVATLLKIADRMYINEKQRATVVGK